MTWSQYHRLSPSLKREYARRLQEKRSPRLETVRCDCGVIVPRAQLGAHALRCPRKKKSA